MIGRREVSRVVEALQCHCGARCSSFDVGGDHQIASEKDDPHSAGVCSDATGVMGPGGISGGGAGAWTPVPFDALRGMPSIT